ALEARNQELTKLNRELDQFVYSVSHDLRAPVASMRGLVELLRAENQDPRLDVYIQMQQTSLLKQDQFIHNLVDFSRNERLPLVPQEIALADLVQTSAAQQGHQPSPTTVQIETDIAQTAPFYSDQRRLGVIFNNLIANALRYQQPNHATPWLKVTGQANHQQAVIQFTDNGIGIAAEHQLRVFDMFYRASEQSVGSGLGLYIVKETLAKLGGQISLSSTLGRGSSFTVTLPNLAPQPIVSSPVHHHYAPHSSVLAPAIVDGY
nr:HAMP domain-containing histidine kinase [Bernardetiaceae bacterium]